MATHVSGPPVRRPVQRAAPPEPFDYESIPAGYYDEVFRRGRGIQSKWHHLKFARVARELDGHRRVLDVGCGPGTLAGNHGAGHDWVGTDLSARQIEYARRAYGHTGARFYRETPAHVPADEGPFDAVTMVELIEHLEPSVVDATIAESLERLRPGGKLVITTPNFSSAWPALEAAVNRFGEVSYGFQHINKFGPERLAALLGEPRPGRAEGRAVPLPRTIRRCAGLARGGSRLTHGAPARGAPGPAARRQCPQA